MIVPDQANDILRQEQCRQFQLELANAYTEQAEDAEFQTELERWETVVGMV